MKSLVISSYSGKKKHTWPEDGRRMRHGTCESMKGAIGAIMRATRVGGGKQPMPAD